MRTTGLREVVQGLAPFHSHSLHPSTDSREGECVTHFPALTIPPGTAPFRPFTGAIKPSRQTSAQNRLIAGINSFGEVPEELRNDLLLIENRRGSKCTYEDAETLARAALLRPDPDHMDNAYSRYIDAGISGIDPALA